MSLFSRFLSAVLTLVLVSAVIFLIFQVIPGDAVLARLGVDADPALEALLRAEMRLDQPPLQRYLSWGFDLLRGDLGNSLRYSMPVNQLISERLPNTLALAVLSFAQVLLFSIPLGLWLAPRADRASGRFFGALTQLLLAVPVFAMAIILMLIFGIWLNLLPISGFVSWHDDPAEFLRLLILPSFALSLPSVAIVVRYLQSSLREQYSEEYVRTARSKGLSEQQILRRHLLRNALLPVLTILGVILINTLGGSIVIEAAFSIPGIGQLLSNAIRSRDLPLVQGLSFYIAAIVVIGFLLLDVLYQMVDPRISNQGGDS